MSLFFFRTYVEDFVTFLLIVLSIILALCETFQVLLHAVCPLQVTTFGGTAATTVLLLLRK